MWVYQAVTNVGIQVLVLMGLGWVFARFRFLEQAKFLPQANFIVLMLALPAFNIYLMGIKLDLQSPDPWKSLAAFLLWVFAVQGAILMYTWRFCGGDAGEAAVINMVLLMDNYAITGLLALNATLGTKWGTLALLMAMGFFLVIFPFSLAAFEWEKWAVQQHVEAMAAAAAADIEAATAAAAAAEEEEAGSGPGSPQGPDVAKGGGRGESPQPRLPWAAASAGAAGRAGASSSDGLELALYDMPAARGDIGPPRREGAEGAPPPADAGAAGAAGAAGGDQLGSPGRGGGGGGSGGTDGFPHESRYCWWSDADYKPAHPLLGGDADSQRGGQLPRKQPWPWLHRHEQQHAQQQHPQQQQQDNALRGTYVPPAHLQPPGVPLVSPFQGWSAATEQQAAAAARPLPATAPPSAQRRPPAGGAGLSPARSGPRPNHGQSVLASAFERLAEAGSGQLPAGLFGDLQRGPSTPGALGLPYEADKPVRLQDLEFALTHQLSGGTVSQLARVSRGYSAAAAAAAAAAASPDANVRRMLLAATAGGGGYPRGRQLQPAPSHRASEPLGTPAALAAAAARSVQQASRASQPSFAAAVEEGGEEGEHPHPQSQPPSGGAGATPTSAAATAALVSPAASASGITLQPHRATPPVALASAASSDGPEGYPLAAPFPTRPPASSETDTAAAAAAVPTASDASLSYPTLSRQQATGLAVQRAASAQPAPPVVSEGGLASSSTPMFSFGRSPHQRRAGTAAATGGSGWSPRRDLPYGSTGEDGRVDRMLLALASGLAANGAKRRGTSRRTDATPMLLDTEPGLLMRLATAASALETGDSAAALAADKKLVREATAEVLRRHGGMVGAFAAFVSGHPQLWHIISTLAKNPMIWTMFVAMAISVSGLRVYLDPASPKYAPAVGWVAGVLMWINGLVVPMSIFSNGAWMYGKKLLPKGELVKMVVLLAIKLGLLPLLMAGCALLVRLDGQHVAAMTVLTLSPAAATSFVLAVQYGRGVELVSLTNILGNVFLTPLLIMWLKILSALQVEYTMHDDARI